MAATVVEETWGPADVQAKEAGADFSAAKGKIVVLSTTVVGRVALAADADSATLPLFGICIENAVSTATSGNIVGIVPITSGKACKVLCDGSGTAVDEGLLITTNASGIGIVTSTAGDGLVGIAQTATANASAMCIVQLNGGVAHSTSD